VDALGGDAEWGRVKESDDVGEMWAGWGGDNACTTKTQKATGA
jgi:hypothetical protein